ncbi:pyrimidine-nucleoside phosphorylase [Bacillus sp. BT1B_CT2]|nr:pyrimidine-nucleoside phosphorylase [Bacillus sp. BT1B_CT2]
MINIEKRTGDHNENGGYHHKKQNGEELTTEEIQFFIKGYTDGSIPDYQASALAMAIYFQDMTDRERADLTMAMVNSGETIDLSAIEGIKVDKHSTGGVGDTTTLVLAPLVAALDVPVAKMSGRGLGHTGGTIDKLEAIKGFHVELSKDEFIELVNRDKVAVIGQSGNLTPADKKLYALRDVTGTVNSIPLIASSIMSKKIAAGADAIVLDVKTGAGAFMKTDEDAVNLAKAMVRIGNNVGRQTMAVISDMSQPLGFAIGNALEVKEAIDTLKGEGPEDLTELVLTLGSQMVVLAKKAETLDEAREKLIDVMKNGKALQKFKDFLQNQGGDSSVADNPEKLPQAAYKIDVPAKEAGVVSEIVADQIGVAAMLLGAGRATKEDKIDLAVGIMLRKKVGDAVEKGEPLVTLYANRENVDDVIAKVYDNIQIAETAEAPKLVHTVITE